MKIQHIYTVTRTFNIPEKELKDEIDYFGAVIDGSGEYLYGGSADKETIDVYMRVFKSGKWEAIKTK